MKKVIQKLYQKLPEPYAISPDQIRSSYQYLYDKLNESFQKNDFVRIYNLLYSSIDSNQLLSFELPSTDVLLLDIAKLIYSIITIYPVKYYKTQLLAVLFLVEFLKTHKQIPGLVLDWHQYYKVMKYYTFSSESFFISGEKIAHIKNEKNSNNMKK